jgi:hypothetical protein
MTTLHPDVSSLYFNTKQSNKFSNQNKLEKPLSIIVNVFAVTCDQNTCAFISVPIAINTDKLLDSISEIMLQAGIFMHLIYIGEMTTDTFNFVSFHATDNIDSTLSDQAIQEVTLCWVKIYATLSSQKCVRSSHVQNIDKCIDTYVLYIPETKQCRIIDSCDIPSFIWSVVAKVSGLSLEIRDIVPFRSIAHAIIAPFNTIQDLDAKLEKAAIYNELIAEVNAFNNRSAFINTAQIHDTMLKKQPFVIQADRKEINMQEVPSKCINEQLSIMPEIHALNNKNHNFGLEAPCINAPSSIAPKIDDLNASEKDQIIKTLHQEFYITNTADTSNRVQAKDVLKVLEKVLSIPKDQLISFRNRLSCILLDLGLKRKRFSEGICYYNMKKRTTAIGDYRDALANGSTYKHDELLRRYCEVRDASLTEQYDLYFDHCVKSYDITHPDYPWDESIQEQCDDTGNNKDHLVKDTSNPGLYIVTVNPDKTHTVLTANLFTMGTVPINNFQLYSDSSTFVETFVDTLF